MGGGGGAKDYVRPCPKPKVPYGQGPGPDYKAPGSSSVFYALLCYLSLISKHSDTKLDKKNIVNKNLGGACVCCAPFWIHHCLYSVLF